LSKFLSFIVGSFYPPLGNISFCSLTECLYSVFFCVSSISSSFLQDDKEYTRVEKYELFAFRWSYFRITFATLHASFTSFYYIFPWRSHKDEQFNCISLSCCYAFFQHENNAERDFHIFPSITCSMRDILRRLWWNLMSKLQFLRPSKLYNSEFCKVCSSKLGAEGTCTNDKNNTRIAVAMANQNDMVT